MNCWAQIASGCAHVYPCLLCESEVGQGSTKKGVCVCVCTVSSGTSNGAMLQKQQCQILLGKKFKHYVFQP